MATTPFRSTKIANHPSGQRIPQNLTTEVASIKQLEERILNLMDHYNVAEQLCTSFGQMITPGNGGGLVWFASVSLPNWNQTIVNVTGPSLEIVVNQAIEQATYSLSRMQGTLQGKGNLRTVRAAGQ